MAWRTDQHYDDARQERDRVWLRSLPSDERRRVRFNRMLRMLVAATALATLAAALAVAIGLIAP